ncbi:YfiT family bacillithiol transferase [Pontibacter chitinilyticus]|uniref:YfiT family bacillithiol transferase n=1 Tax=Pontibacter chitinilyticus TaxID=2674989 RepID=UPI00321B1D40
MQADLRYPIGNFDIDNPVSEELLNQYILSIAQLPGKLRAVLQGLNAAQLDTPYRPGGWTMRQVVHHLPDSHLNGYTRQKLALTEDRPIIKPYDEAAWAKLPDSTQGDPQLSVILLEALHQRWVLLLQGLTPQQLDRTFVHPVNGAQRIRQHIGLYAWHGEHHLAQLVALKQSRGW